MSTLRCTVNFLRSYASKHSQAKLVQNYQKRNIQTTPAWLSAFETAKERLNTLKNEPDNTTKLRIYALFKQATAGDCNTKKPGAMDFVGKAKWNAWDSLKGTTQPEAENMYVALVEELAAAEGSSASSSGDSKYELIEYSVDGAIAKILLNRPEKKNALTVQMYNEIEQALKESAENSSKITVITGAGNFYCSGNDLGNFANITPDTIKKAAEDGSKTLQAFVGSFIDFSKPLIAAVNGPAVGIAVTTLGLCDAVYASEQATFHAPLVALGQTAEGCSSYTFPKIMGFGMASEVLLFGKKLTSHEAKAAGLVTDVFPEATFHKELEARLAKLATLPPKALAQSKQLIRQNYKAKLHEVNAAECQVLEKLWQSDECINAIMKFFSEKS